MASPYHIARMGSPYYFMNDVKIEDIKSALSGLSGYYGVYVPEFTWRDLRIDAIVIDTSKRWIRGFEIKMSRSDFLQDEKWHKYSQFCSSLSIVCPKGLIQPNEIENPFGLLWVGIESYPLEWVKKPKRFQKDCMAWHYTYVDVLEKEIARLAHPFK